ncbi:MAG: hypothetical protein QM708_11105 [Propioniciclava sp.]|uniref:hypothetical protein n=1 Tax=Propioniciclava sp. TaxID=2038686 RepID=UPI0039E3AB62
MMRGTGGTSGGWTGYLAGLWLVALAVRQLPLVVTGRWAGEFSWDEGVYMVASQKLINGVWPYADFLLVHPPGIVLFLTPFAALANVIPDAIAASIARTAISALGATSAVLVALLLRRYGRAAAVAGSVLYAVWSATVWSEWAILLEPLLAVGVLGALLLLGKDAAPATVPSLRRTATAGAILGLGLTVKLWAAVPLAVLALMLLVRSPNRLGWGRAVAFGGAAIAAVAVVMTPFLVVAGPATVWRDVVGFQIGRPEAPVSWGTRLAYFNGSLLAPDRLPDAVWLAVGLAALVVSVVAVVALARARAVPLRTWEPTSWLVLATAQVLVLLNAPSFYPTYTLAAAPALCLVAGIAAQFLVERLRIEERGPVIRRGVAGFGVAVALVLVVMSTRQIGPGLHAARDWSVVDRLEQEAAGVDGPRCVWAPTPEVLLEADVADDQTRQQCPTTIDVYATVLRELGVADAEFDTSAPFAQVYQAQVAAELANSEVAIVDEAAWKRLNEANQDLIHDRFVPEGTAGPYTIWRADDTRPRS